MGNSIFDSAEESTEGRRPITISPDVYGHYFDLLRLASKYSSSDENSLTINFSRDESNVENEVNRLRVQEYRAAFSREFLESIRHSDFEFGIDTVADVFIRSKLRENALAIKECINELFIQNFHDVIITAGILRVIAHLNYEQIAPQGATMAIASLAHTSLEIKELGIRAFENWSAHESLAALESLIMNDEWLATYLASVIDDLRRIHSQ